jgi:hypothetical protein
MRPSAARVAERHLRGRGFYDDIADLTDDILRERVFELTDRIEADARDAERRVRAIKEAWSRRDMKALVDEGVLDQKSISLLSRIYAAQQAGDESLIDRLLRAL